MWKWLGITVITTLIQVVSGEYEAYSVALGQTPTVAIVPDLSILTEKDYKCFSTEGNLACPGYDFYLPISGYYGYSSSDFAAYVNTEMANDSGYIVATCPDANIQHDVSKIAYRYSVYCGRLMYSQVRWCKENPDGYKTNSKLLLCRRTCMEYAQSILDYGTTVCGDSTVAEKISNNIIERWCNLFTDDEGCIEGITSEVSNCGYASASLSAEAVNFNPNNACWKQPDKIEEMKQKATVEESTEVKMGGIKWKVAYPVAVMVIIGGLTYYFWRRQNEQFKTGYTNIPDPEPEYDYIPSGAEPSRDYISPGELEFPSSTLPRNSSYAVSTLSRTNRSNDTSSNVLYMVAIYNYHAKMEDELELKAGDRIRVEHQYNDGWAAGINETTNKFGAFPLICCSDNISSNQDKLPVRNRSRMRTGNPAVRTLERSPLARKDN